MNKINKEIETEIEKLFCNNCNAKKRIEQCLWAWRRTNGLNIPDVHNCSCKEVPEYFIQRSGK